MLFTRQDPRLWSRCSSRGVRARRVLVGAGPQPGEFSPSWVGSEEQSSDKTHKRRIKADGSLLITIIAASHWAVTMRQKLSYTLSHLIAHPCYELVLSHFSCVWLCNPMGLSPPGSSVHGLLQAKIPEWVAIPSSRGSSPPRNWTCVSYVSCIWKQILYHELYLGSPLWAQERKKKTPSSPSSISTFREGHKR